MEWSSRSLILASASSFLLFSLLVARNVSSATVVPVSIGVVLDLATVMGKKSLASISMALEDFYVAHPNFTTRVSLHVRDSRQDVVTAASAAIDLIKIVQVQAVIGPQCTAEAEFVTYIANKTHVPTVAFSTTGTTISPSHVPFFIRAAANDASQAAPIADFVQYFGWRNVVLVYEDNNNGVGILPYLVDALQSVDTLVPYRAAIPTAASDDRIDAELYKLMTMQTRVFLVHASPNLGSHLFLRVTAIGMMTEGSVWIVTDGIGDVLDVLDPAIIGTMQGVVGFRPFVPVSNKIINFTSRFRARFRQENAGYEMADPTIFQYWAYDATWAIALAAEEAKDIILANLSFQKPQSGGSLADFDGLGVSQAGPKLLNSILEAKFDGLAGMFELAHGQLQLSTYEIVNVIGKAARGIGFWRPRAGLSRFINSTTNGIKISSSNNNVAVLKPVIWPGDFMGVPKGWVIPTNGKELRIAVPVRHGYKKFVDVSTDPTTNISTFSGYCIEIFEAAVKKLPFNLKYEYFPYDCANSYDRLVDEVIFKHFDAAVGDVTIIANRSNYVDFTLPYTESGVSMVVLAEKDHKSTMWIFLQPLTMSLWIVIVWFFFLTAFIVWMIEHPINHEFFHGSRLQQFGNTCFFAFSTLFFSQRETIRSNLTKVAVVIWCFVVLVLTQSYTASLSSMLTVQRLQPSVTDLSQLLQNGDYVGYQNGSFVHGLLKRHHFDERKLRIYSKPDEYADALRKGSNNGGVSAIFDEIPYLKFFLADYGDDFKMVGPTYKTAGFAFVFPKGSPLVHDMSKAILNVTEGDEGPQIEAYWLGDSTTCSSCQSPNANSSPLNLRSFAGLFIVTGTVSILMLLINIGKFVYSHWGTVSTATSERRPWEIMSAYSRRYDPNGSSTSRGAKVHSGDSESNQGEDSVRKDEV